ncbi:hypothetical protein ABFO95_004388 [Enterobacter kobei]
MKEIEDARELIEEQLLNLDHDNHIVRLKQWKKFEIKFNEFVVKTSHSYANLDKRFVTAFSYVPPTE